MKKTIRDQLLARGIVKTEDTPEFKLERDRRQRRAAEILEQESRLADDRPLPSFEAPALLTSAPSSASLPAPSTITCRLCGKDVPERMVAKVDECNLCTEEVEERVRGQMEWVHKSVPVLHIEGRPVTSPEDYAKMRRR
jgi:hypothetical protein